MVEFLGALIGLVTTAVGLYTAVWKARKTRAEAKTAEGLSQGTAPSPSQGQHEQWYVARRREDRTFKDGPFTMQRLRRLAAQGQLVPHDMLLKEGTQRWTAASTVEGLFGTHWLNLAARAMIVVSVLAILLDLLMLQTPTTVPGSKCKLLMSVVHAGFGIFAAVEILRRKSIVIAYLGSVMGIGAWFWNMVVWIDNRDLGAVLIGLPGTLAGIGVGIWAFLLLLDKRVVAEFQGIQQVAEPKEMFKEVYRSKPVFLAVSGGLALLLVLWVISLAQSPRKEKEPWYMVVPESEPSKRKPLDKRLVGKWELIQGGDRWRRVDYDRTTLDFTANGTFIFSATGKYNSDDDPPEPSYRKGQRYEHTLSGKVWAVEDGKLEFVEQYHASRLSPDFVSDTELLLVNDKSGESLAGKWRRVK
jgi:hypothetical protein